MDSFGACAVKRGVTKLRNKHYYDQFSATYEEHRGEGYHAFIDDLTSELVSRYLPQSAHLLEAGCGTGLVLRRLQERAAQAVGIDLSMGMLRKAQSKRLDVVCGSVTDLPFPDACFDVVCSFKVLAHVEPIEQALREMSRVLRPGGYLLTEFYNTWSLRYLIKRLKRPTRISGGISDDAVFTRYDSLSQIRSYFPADIQLETVHGLRVLTPFSATHSWPIFGPALQTAERKAAVLPGVRRFGGFLLTVGRKIG